MRRNNNSNNNNNNDDDDDNNNNNNSNNQQQQQQQSTATLVLPFTILRAVPAAPFAPSRPAWSSWENIMADGECQKAVVAKLLGYLLILGSLTVKAPQARGGIRYGGGFCGLRAMYLFKRTTTPNSNIIAVCTMTRT